MRSRSDNRRYVGLVVGLGLLVSGAAAGAAAGEGGEGPVTVPAVAPYEFRADAGFNPKSLSGREQTPVAMRLGAEIQEPSGGQPPAIRELDLELDDAIEVHTAGIPTCGRGRLQEADPAAASKECGSALVGEGEATVRVALPASPAIEVVAKVMVFKGNERNGKATLLLDAHFSKPISGSILIPATVTRRPHGSFGTLAVVKIPQIAGGAGSLTKFDVQFFKRVEAGGQTYNPITAVCRDEKLNVRTEAKFENLTTAASEAIRACSPEG